MPLPTDTWTYCLRTHLWNDSVIEAEIRRSARLAKSNSIFAVCTRHLYFAVITFRSVYTFSRFCRHRESDQGILLNYFVKVNHLSSMFNETRQVITIEHAQTISVPANLCMRNKTLLSLFVKRKENGNTKWFREIHFTCTRLIWCSHKRSNDFRLYV